MSSKRTPIVLSNWKMNKTVAQSLDYLESLMQGTAGKSGRMEIILCVPFSVIKSMADKLNGPGMIALAGQDVHWEPWGAYTGEISAPMLSDAGARFCMIGHSERRKYFDETDEQVNQKARALLQAGVKPIVCIGETLEERRLRLTVNILERQLRVCFDGFSASDLTQTVILYEPRWAIGTGQFADADQIAEAHHYIRIELGRLFSADSADRTRILYGGSVTPENASAILKITDVDGVGVGGASLDPANFLQVVNAISGV
jgi:triosephosphate isomerase (TIM)